MKNRVSLEYIGQRLREIRKARGMSQQDVAQRMGIPQSNLSRIENGKQRLNLTVLAGILTIYGMEMDDFFAVSPEEEPRPVEQEERELLLLFRRLGAEDRRDVREFLEFKVTRSGGRSGDDNDEEEAWHRR